MSIASKNERGGALATLFVRRPVMAVVINALIMVAGLAALLGIEVRELPASKARSSPSPPLLPAPPRKPSTAR